MFWVFFTGGYYQKGWTYWCNCGGQDNAWRSCRQKW